MRLIMVVYGTEMRVSSPEAFYQYLSEVLSQFADKEEFEIFMSGDRRYNTSKKMAVFLYFSLIFEDKAAEIKEKLKTALKDFFPNGIGEKIPIIPNRMAEDIFAPAAVQPAKVSSLNIALETLEQTPLIRFLLRTRCFETVADIASKSERELLKMKVGIGRGRLAQIKQFLRGDYNVELRLS